jgi:hypothetical protein
MDDTSNPIAWLAICILLALVAGGLYWIAR